MAKKLFYARQSERTESVCRNFIKKALEHTSTALKQSGVDERLEVDSDTQDVPGSPEILNTILRKIVEDDIFIADLTMCSASDSTPKRLAPNPNVMFEYGYALSVKGRDRLICVMNVFFGGNEPEELPFDLRHARAPIRYSLSPDASPAKKEKVFNELTSAFIHAAKLILDKLPRQDLNTPRIDFDKPHFEEGQELSPEGDFYPTATTFGICDGFVYLKAHPLTEIELSIAQLKKLQDPGAGLTISSASSGGATGTNKWGRVSFGIANNVPQNQARRTSRDYVQYFREGDLEIINGSFLTTIGPDTPLHIEYLVQQIISPMLRVLHDWMNKIESDSWLVELGIDGIEKRRLVRQSTYGNRGGPMLHLNRVLVRKEVNKNSVLSLAQEFETKILAEGGIEV